MQIKSNTLLKVIVPVVLLSAVMIGVKSCGGSKQTQDSADNTTVADLTQEELSILGIEGDTPQDTLRTLVGRIKTIQTNQENLEKQNAALAEENARLQNKGNNVDGRINDAVNAVKQESTQAQQKLQAEQQRLAGLLESLKNTVPGSRFPVRGRVAILPPAVTYRSGWGWKMPGRLKRWRKARSGLNRRIVCNWIVTVNR